MPDYALVYVPLPPPGQRAYADPQIQNAQVYYSFRAADHEAAEESAKTWLKTQGYRGSFTLVLALKKFETKVITTTEITTASA